MPFEDCELTGLNVDIGKSPNWFHRTQTCLKNAKTAQGMQESYIPSPAEVFHKGLISSTTQMTQIVG